LWVKVSIELDISVTPAILLGFVVLLWVSVTIEGFLGFESPLGDRYPRRVTGGHGARKRHQEPWNGIEMRARDESGDPMGGQARVEERRTKKR
jgi:hypothetical protein